MRIISFSKMWDKLKQPEFTTFRFPRADSDKGRDWRVGEKVQVYFQSRSPNRKKLGEAIITSKEPRQVEDITDDEAIADGFRGRHDMYDWLKKTHSLRKERFYQPINKLALKWI